MFVEPIKSIESVPKRNAFKTHNYDNVGLINWVDFADVREHFSYSTFFNPIIFFKRDFLIVAIVTFFSLAIFSNLLNVSFSNAVFIYFETLSSESLVNKRSIERSCGTRTCNFTDLLFFIPVGILRHPVKYIVRLIQNNFNRNLTRSPPLVYSVVHLMQKYKCINNDSPKSSHLNEPSNPTIKVEVMIMANRYDSAHLCARQSKLFKFYDLSTAQVVQSIAPTERQARRNLGRQSLIFIARIQLYPTIENSTNWGGFNYE